MDWLLVFDDANAVIESNILDDFWPPGGRGSILVTTRDKASLGRFTGVIREVRQLEERDAVELLARTSGLKLDEQGQQNAAKICAELGCLPLTICAAAFIIHADDLSFAEYLSLYPNRDLIIKHSKPIGGRAMRYPLTPSTVWNPSLDRLDPETTFLLNILAFLDPDKISEELLLAAARKGCDSRLNFINSAHKFVGHRTRLTHRGLVVRNPDLKQLWMHRMVRDTCHWRMDRKSYQTAFDVTLKMVYNRWPVPELHNRHNRRLWVVQQEYLPHIFSLAECYQASVEADEDDEIQSGITFPLETTQLFPELVLSGAWYGSWLSKPAFKC